MTKSENRLLRAVRVPATAGAKRRVYLPDDIAAFEAEVSAEVKTELVRRHAYYDGSALAERMARERATPAAVRQEVMRRVSATGVRSSTVVPVVPDATGGDAATAAASTPSKAKAPRKASTRKSSARKGGR